MKEVSLNHAHDFSVDKIATNGSWFIIRDKVLNFYSRIYSWQGKKSDKSISGLIAEIQIMWNLSHINMQILILGHWVLNYVHLVLLFCIHTFRDVLNWAISNFKNLKFLKNIIKTSLIIQLSYFSLLTNYLNSVAFEEVLVLLGWLKIAITKIRKRATWNFHVNYCFLFGTLSRWFFKVCF